MLGKIRVRHAPWTNHGWHLTLRVSPQGLSTLPTSVSDGRTFTLALDLSRNHAITLEVSDGASAMLPFAGRRPSSASAARCISSGAASTLR
jgi:hypothetical protein